MPMVQNPQGIIELQAMNWQVVDVAMGDGEQGRSIILQCPQSRMTFAIPFPMETAADVGSQLQGNGPSKLIVANGSIPDKLLRNGHG